MNFSSSKHDNILSLLRSDSRFSILVSHLTKSRDLSDTLTNTPNLTFLAPTDHAFNSLLHTARNMREIIHYHMLTPAIRFVDFYEGQLLDTKLVERFLDDENQKIRVQRRYGRVTFNHFVGIDEMDLEAGNGIVHVLDQVLLPPSPISHNLSMLPFNFSTSLSAIQSIKMFDALTIDKSITCFIPTNHAWSQLNPVDLTYLFTAPGSVDLQKIINYHICKSLIYTPDFLDTQVQLETYHEDQTITVRASARKLIKSGEDNPERWVISVNGGEATIRSRGADYLGRNGNVYGISNVLVPAGVVLPSMKSTAS